MYTATKNGAGVFVFAAAHALLSVKPWFHAKIKH